MLRTKTAKTELSYVGIRQKNSETYFE